MSGLFDPGLAFRKAKNRRKLTQKLENRGRPAQ